MANTFDTLKFTKRLEAGGIARSHAEAHAEAANEFIMRDVVTKGDLQAALDRQTIKIGAIVVTVAGVLFALLRLFPA